MATEEAKVNDFPTEIQDRLEAFHEALKDAKSSLSPLLTCSVKLTDLKISPLDKARLHLTSAYALNSLFWMYLNTIGVDPKEHGIKDELGRIKNYMLKAKEIVDRGKAPHLNKDAAQRFVRNSLWNPKQTTDEDSATSVTKQRSKELKRKSDSCSVKEEFKKRK